MRGLTLLSTQNASCVWWNDDFVCATWLVCASVCDMTRLCVQRDSFVCAAWLVRVFTWFFLFYNMTHSLGGICNDTKNPNPSKQQSLVLFHAMCILYTFKLICNLYLAYSLRQPYSMHFWIELRFSRVRRRRRLVSYTFYTHQHTEKTIRNAPNLYNQPKCNFHIKHIWRMYNFISVSPVSENFFQAVCSRCMSSVCARAWRTCHAWRRAACACVHMYVQACIRVSD